MAAGTKPKRSPRVAVQSHGGAVLSERSGPELRYSHERVECSTGGPIRSCGTATKWWSTRQKAGSCGTLASERSTQQEVPSRAAVLSRQSGVLNRRFRPAAVHSLGGEVLGRRSGVRKLPVPFTAEIHRESLPGAGLYSKTTEQRNPVPYGCRKMSLWSR